MVNQENSSSIRVVVHYNEIALKGKNTQWMEERLVDNIRFALHDLAVSIPTKNLHRRIMLTLPAGIAWEEVAKRLQRVFGVAYFARFFSCPPVLEEVKTAVMAIMPKEDVTTFAVRNKRDDKTFPMTSLEIEREVGGFIQDHRGWKVDLEHPQLTIYCEWMKKHVLFYLDHSPGPRGLPVGIAGKVLCLISGGIDSPVAAHFMMKRGCHADFIHFHSFPLTDALSQDKVAELIKVICQYRYQARLYLVPFGALQQVIVTNTPPAYRMILYRRFMLRIAEKIAISKNLEALVTGESLSQVASQTLSNLATIQASTKMPVLRPLIGFDKQEIIDVARTIGTYDISIQPHGDCCTFLMPKSPKVRSSIPCVEEIEKNLQVTSLVEEAVSKVTCQEL